MSHYTRDIKFKFHARHPNGGEYFSRPLLNFLIFLISDIDNLRWITNLSIRIQDEAMNHSNLILLH